MAQTWDPAGYAHHAGFVPALGAPVVELLAPQAGERILDLGCGDGVLTLKLVESGAEVLGLDSSPELLAAAKAKGIATRQGDGEKLAFQAEFDAVFTNAAMHWMKNHRAVIAGVAMALRPGGRFVGECGGFGNVAAIVTALHAAAEEFGVDPGPLNPWFFASAEGHRSRLKAAGFEVLYCELIPRPTPLPTGIEGWLGTFAKPFLMGMEREYRLEYLERVEALLRPALCDESGAWSADYVRLRFAARLAE